VRLGRTFVGTDPFAVLLGDTLLESTCGRPVLGQLLDVREARGGGSVVALEEVPLEKVSRYGVIDGPLEPDGTVTVRGLVEKPSPAEAPSRRVIASRYVLEPEIFDCLDRTPPGKGGEIQLTDAMRLLLQRRPMAGCMIRGIRHDAGNKLDYLKTNIHYALQRPDMREPLLAYLRDIVRD
jgi:UTP--glucose-1-phosphate uridylyltransferase